MRNRSAGHSTWQGAFRDVGREAAQDPKVAEFDLLGSGTPIIGADSAREPLFAQTLDIPHIDCCATPDGPLLDSVVAVHRLRACLYGFTRLEPAPTFAEDMLEDVRIAVWCASVRGGRLAAGNGATRRGYFYQD